MANRFGADSIGQPQDDHLVAKELQGPAAATLGRVAASQTDQLLLKVPLDLDLTRPQRLEPGVERLLEALGDQALAHATDGTEADPQGGDDLVIGAFPSGRAVRQQQDAGVGEPAGRCLAHRNQVFQPSSFFRSQGNSVFLHGGARLLGSRSVAYSSSYGSPTTYQSKIDGPLVVAARRGGTAVGLLDGGQIRVSCGALTSC